MAHALTFQFATSTNYVLSLAPAGSADIYRAGYVKITARSTTVAMAAVQHNCWIKPVVVEPTGTVPSPAAISDPAPGAVNGVAFVDSTENAVFELGQLYAKGFVADVHGRPVATHLMISGGQGGILDIIVD